MAVLPVLFGDPPVPLVKDDGGGNTLPAVAEDPCLCCSDLEPADCSCPPCTTDNPNWPPTVLMTVAGFETTCAYMNGTYELDHVGCQYLGSGTAGSAGWSAFYKPCGTNEFTITDANITFQIGGTTQCNVYAPKVTPTQQLCLAGIATVAAGTVSCGACVSDTGSPTIAVDV